MKSKIAAALVIVTGFSAGVPAIASAHWTTHQRSEFAQSCTKHLGGDSERNAEYCFCMLSHLSRVNVIEALAIEKLHPKVMRKLEVSCLERVR